MSGRIRLGVAEGQALGERAMRGIGFDAEEARILTNHVMDAALCGYEYSGLPKLLNIVDEFTREALAMHVARGIDADQTVAVLDRLALKRGAP